jgi:hypothetical protein
MAISIIIAAIAAVDRPLTASRHSACRQLLVDSDTSLLLAVVPASQPASIVHRSGFYAF